MAGPTFGKNPPPNEMNFGLVTAQHRRSWDTLCAQWRWIAETGWDSAWGFDHIMSLYDGDDGPCLEGWTVLAGLANVAPRLQLGLMVTSITHRHPAMLAKEVVTVDVISGGRLILGVGAGWQAREHQAFGIPFPPAGERVDRFGEVMEIYRRLETQERTSFRGEYYTLDDAPFEPKPVFGHVPILIGSTGRRMLRHVARYADQWDGGGTVEAFRASGARLDALCREIDRDPSEIRWVMTTGGDPLESEEAFERHVRSYAELGVRSFNFDFPPDKPTNAMQRIAEHVIPKLRREYAYPRQVEPA